MGGRYEAQMCVALLEEQFGKVVAVVAETLFKEDCHLPALVYKLKDVCKLPMIRKALTVLINFGIVSFTLDTNKKPLYTAHTSSAIRLLSVPRCCLVAKTLYGSIAEDICIEMCANGQLTCSEVLRRAFARDESVAIDDLKKTFTLLTDAQFLIRCAPVTRMVHGCPEFRIGLDPFIMPEAILSPSSDGKKEENRKRKAERMKKDVDDGIYWRMNWKRFELYARDEMIMTFLTSNLAADDRMTDIFVHTIRSIFKSNEVRNASLKTNNTTPVSFYDIVRCIKDNNLDVEKADIEFALRTLCEDSDGVLRKAGESAGGIYTIDMEKAVTLICRQHCESLVREQFDKQAVRIMRLLESRNFLDEEQVERLTMMSGKQTKELLYALIEEGYVFTKPIGRANDFQPGRTFYLYHVDLHRTVRGLIEYTCKFIRNLILRNAHERKENKNLIEKDLTKGPIIEGIRTNPDLDDATKKAQIDEVEEMYLPGPDRAALDKFRHARAMLLAAQDKSGCVLFAFRLLLDIESSA